jgi:GAF domain
MPEPVPGQDVLREALAQSAIEQRRADRAARVAARHEAAADESPQLREFHLRMAGVHRQVERRHRAAAAVHHSFAERLRMWHAAVTPPDPDGVPPLGLTPMFLAAVADSADAQGAAVTLFGQSREEVLSAASDGKVKSVQDLEFVCGEGPAHTCNRHRRAVIASGAEITRRWPLYGPAALRLGVQRLAAVPIEIGHRPVGALTVYEPGVNGGVADIELLRTIAGSLHSIALTNDASPTDLYPLFTEADLHDVVHQATGIVAVQRGCSTEDALAVIKARAFAADLQVDQLAEDLVARRIRLED